MKQVTFEQATQHLGDLIDAALTGEEVIVTRDHRPAVRLVPVEAPAPIRPQFGSAKGLITMSEDFDASLGDFREYTE